MQALIKNLIGSGWHPAVDNDKTLIVAKKTLLDVPRAPSKESDFFIKYDWISSAVRLLLQQKEQDVESEAVVISFDVSAPKFQLSVKKEKDWTKTPKMCENMILS